MKKNNIRTIHELISRDQKRYYKKIIKTYEKYNYYYQSKRSIVNTIKLAYYTIKRNVLSPKRNIWLLGDFGPGLKICHANVVIARQAKIGKNVIFHGNNCVGVKSDSFLEAPIIGNNVDVGYGAMIIGNVKIADGSIIGAGSLVVKDIIEKGIYGGVPARRIK